MITMVLVILIIKAITSPTPRIVAKTIIILRTDHDANNNNNNDNDKLR